MDSPTYLIIGSGIAGLNCSLNAAQLGQVTIVTKKKTVDSSTNFAQGGIASVLEKTDSFKQHVADTLEAGSHHNNRRAVSFMVKHGPEAIKGLIEVGVPFATEEGKLLLTREGGHLARRIAFVGDYTGKEIEKALVSKAKKHPRITILQHTFAADLIIHKNTCYGVTVITGKKIRPIFADFTILATGGLGQIYSKTTNPGISTGDGIAMGYRAGLRAKDLEFIQFHPTVFFPTIAQDKPQPVVGSKFHPFLISEAVRGEGAILLNHDRKRFMTKYHPLAELAPRDIVSRALFEEERKGTVYLSIKHASFQGIQVRFPTIYQTLKEHGYDLTKDDIPVSPAAHYACGGIVTDLQGKTTIRNLYAFGEVAWTGVHGANRLASNSLLEALVFSNQIIQDTRKYQRLLIGKNLKALNPERKIQKLSFKEKTTISAIRTRLKQTMWTHAGIIRTLKGLKKAEMSIDTLLKRLKSMPHTLNQDYIETLNMLQTSLLVTRAAIKRKKSLGCHYVSSK